MHTYTKIIMVHNKVYWESNIISDLLSIQPESQIQRILSSNANLLKSVSTIDPGRIKSRRIHKNL